ncbi:serpin family protein [uncultured Acetobacterium sp.]|uniref:serpin family protein n=1 Tax=uncultured Acetobacterium sp. TaxID=217139 RepID=UPI0025F3103B|nr:serpin family protein [uncultured Acetobacterium sp.]
MKRRLAVLVGVLGMAALLLMGAGCKKTDISKPDAEVLNAFDADMVEKSNDFGFNLYKNLALENENMMISPVSVSLAMEMAYNGAAGATREAMAKALNIQGIDVEQLNKNNRALIYFLTTAAPEVNLNIANSIWMVEDFKFSEVFLETVQDSYQAEAKKLDFTDPKSAEVINKWVKDQTQGTIDQIVTPPIDPETIMFLINAVYFKGAWTSPFEKELTTDQPFKLADGQTVTVPTMYQSGSFDYLKSADFQALRLPYGEDEQIAMMLFLPNEGVSLEEFQKQLNGDNWSKWISLFEQKEGSLMLPKFTMAYEKSLNQPLTELGMGIAFEAGKADFSGLAEDGTAGNIYISEVKHKTFIEVDEVGTEAAAVTSVEVGVTSMPAYDFELNFDRPFFYAIQDSESGAIIFIGAVFDPS